MFGSIIGSHLRRNTRQRCGICRKFYWNQPSQQDDKLVNDFVTRIQQNEEFSDLFISKLDERTRIHIANAILDTSPRPSYQPSALSGRHRRAIAISALSELTGRNPDDELTGADRNKDGVVDRMELRKWLKEIQPKDTNKEHAHPGEISTQQYMQLATISAIPFIGFGFLDNCIMLMAGESIDRTFGVVLGISTLASAGLGNLVSDVVGLGAGGWIEEMALKSGLKDPNLTKEQSREFNVRMVRFIATAVGISIGCILGMFPLLFIDPVSNELQEVFSVLDKNGNGTIDVLELKAFISASESLLGADAVTELLERAEAMGSRELNFNDFCEYINTLRNDLSAKEIGIPDSSKFAEYLYSMLADHK